jgi:hypothetical protein
MGAEKSWEQKNTNKFKMIRSNLSISEKGISTKGRVGINARSAYSLLIEG